MAHPDVVEAAVVGAPCPVLGERVHAFVLPASAGARRASDLAAPLRRAARRLQGARHLQLPCRPLPRNANGKVMKRELKDEFQ